MNMDKSSLFKIKFALLFLLVMPFTSFAQNEKVITGAEQTDIYLPLLATKKVAVFANQTSMIGNEHLVDVLFKNKINIVKIFSPEHGFRGSADAGEHVADGKDIKTGLPIISLYGVHQKPTAADLKDIDVVLFDIQDVGVRFYTYISSLQYVLEACIENDKKLILLDRPNPNGFYVDGPVLDRKFSSFVGMQPVPVVYGMTMGEYAKMLVGELWLSKNANDIICRKKQAEKNQTTYLEVIACKNYDHETKYNLPVSPSPNLREMQSIYWYPSTCYFEGTVVSEGRGTDKPFQIFGHPSLPKNLFSFTPAANEGAKTGKCFGEKCYGYNLTGSQEETLEKIDGQIQLKYFLEVYRLFPDKQKFFLANNFIDKLTGSDQFRQQVISGKTEKEIKASWQPGLQNFKKIRAKYLLYKDFE